MSAVASSSIQQQGTHWRDLSPPRAAEILSYAILFAGAATVLTATYLVIIGHSKLPYWDGWTQIDFAANEGPGHTFDWLWRQFNQHRVLVPKLFLLADLRWFRATQISLLTANLVIQFLHLTLLGWSMRRFGGWTGALWRTGAGLAAFCLFCPSQWPNFLMGFTGLCCFLPPFFVSLSIVGLLLYWQSSRETSSANRSWMYLLLSMAAALCATFSLSNGNLLWPMLLMAALVLRVPRAGIGMIAAVAAAGMFAFFYNYTVYISATSLVHSPGELVALIKYVAVYFGSSWVQNSITLAEMVGVAGALLFLFVLSLLPAYFRASPAFCVQLTVTLLFMLATGIVTAPGRLVFGIEQAFSGRYQSFALLYWCCLALLLLGTYSRRMGTRALLTAEMVLLLVMVFAATKAETPLGKARWQAFNLDAAAMALVTDVPDNPQLVWADSHPSYMRTLVPYMRSEGLSVFSRPEISYLGQELSSVLQAGSDCAGKVESTTVITNSSLQSLRITGWSWDLRNQRAPSQIVVTAEGVISGLGVVGDWRPKHDIGSGRSTGHYPGFTAYARDVPKSAEVDVYAVLQGGKAACLIGSLRSE